MGREVRRVPADWQHPVAYVRAVGGLQRNARIRFVGLLNSDYSTALAQHLEDCEREPELYGPDDAPEPEWYRPSWTDDERTHFQAYETVSEGTPVSPVFATAEELVEFLVNEGEWFSDREYGRESAEMLVSGVYIPSMAMIDGKTYRPENIAEARR